MEFLKTIYKAIGPIPILDNRIPVTDYCPIDLSVTNSELDAITISNVEACQEYVTYVLNRGNSKVAYGGYLEQRSLYGNSDRFLGIEPRNIHLGMDFWCDAGTKVLAPLEGVVHSFANNSDFGNYGPTIILTHEVKGNIFHTLYGHLSMGSLDGLYVGKVINAGDVLAALGTPDINVGYAPHLHFQLILDMGDYQGDYPGVCTRSDLPYFSNNCPNPNLLLGYGAMFR
ncbi:MAG: peptidoglycan DD-metalloendopeptidase family protein [Bacteroidota bacterium]